MLKDTRQIGLKKFLLVVKLKIQFHGHVINGLNDEEIIGTFYEKELKKAKQKGFGIEKVIKRKGDKLYDYMSNGKVIIIRLKVGLIKKI